MPAVKERKDAGRQVVLPAPVAIATGSANSADQFAVGVLAEEIGMSGVAVDLRTAKRRPLILIGRPGQPEVDRALAAAGLAQEAVPARPESYLIHSDSRRVIVAARDDAGVYYGVQTLRQLLRPAAGGIELPAVDIRDWPEMAFRGLSVDLAQGAVPTEAQMRRIIETAAEYKLNVVSFYVQHLMAFRASPLMAPPGAELDGDAIRRLSEVAARNHVTLLPQQQTFGHLHHLLKHELYTDLGEAPYGTTLTAGDPAVYRWIESAVSELSALFPGTLFHAGGDETWDLGKGVNKDAVAREGQAKLWADHMTRVAEILRQKGRRTLFWGDIALKAPGQIARLPKDMIAATWTYEPNERFADYITPFRKAGLDVVVCPSVNNWSKPVPDFDKAVANIGRFVAEGRRQQAMGMLNTVWFDDGESLFDTVWYGVVYSAAASWEGADSPRERFDESFDWAFYRAPDAAIARAVRKLGEVHQAMRDAGFVDADNGHVWLDPYSARGAAVYARVGPQARRIRLLSEEALTEIVTARPRCRLHKATLDSLEFGARRLDWFGMKVQFAARIQTLYRDAWENQQDTRRANYDLLNISDINGLVQDLRDEAGEMKEQYRKLWLSVNRPYLLNSMSGLYDRELLYWLDKATRMAEVRANYRKTHSLPDPLEVGLAVRGSDIQRR
ncbi:MAG: glycoside hydrolase family 20 zincin-like fold domain-containing protein [Bryobacteraceae bacterium]|nr:glycoside hydrolase family 20 zincin-like fold domain-containing protein [Bryobacteraceae bacterium]